MGEGAGPRFGMVLVRPVWESKLLVVGEGGVGKTQLLRALCREPFQAGTESETTWGIDVRPLELPHPEHDDVTMTLKCWDFGGQNIYHATHPGAREPRPGPELPSH